MNACRIFGALPVAACAAPNVSYITIELPGMTAGDLLVEPPGFRMSPESPLSVTRIISPLRPTLGFSFWPFGSAMLRIFAESISRSRPSAVETRHWFWLTCRAAIALID